MICPVCGGKTGVASTWHYDAGTTLRQHVCKACNHSFYTKEEACDKYWQAGWRAKNPLDENRRGLGPTWDIARGKAMYDEGRSLADIARAVGVRYGTVYVYARRNWYPKREAGK